MLEFGTQKQKITSNGVKREYMIENRKVRCATKAMWWERICDQMAEEIAELRNSDPA